MIHDKYNKLTNAERIALDEAFRVLMRILSLNNAPIAGDDRAERAVEACARAIIESRENPEGSIIRAAIENAQKGPL